jgi:hypothetical protein
MSTIPTYPILYKINSNNKISEWEIKIIKKGPKWTPANQNGRPVNAYRSQPIIFQVAAE